MRSVCVAETPIKYWPAGQRWYLRRVTGVVGVIVSVTPLRITSAAWLETAVAAKAKAKNTLRNTLDIWEPREQGITGEQGRQGGYRQGAEDSRTRYFPSVGRLRRRGGQKRPRKASTGGQTWDAGAELVGYCRLVKPHSPDGTARASDGRRDRTDCCYR